MLILPVSLMLLRLAVNPLRSPLLGTLVGERGEMGEASSAKAGGSGDGDGDGPKGEVILKFFLEDLSEVAGEPRTTSCSGASSDRGVVTESGIMLLRDGGGLMECLEEGGVVRSCVGGWGLFSAGRLLFLTRLKVLVTPFNRVMVGVLGDLAGLVASSGVSALGTSSE